MPPNVQIANHVVDWATTPNLCLPCICMESPWHKNFICTSSSGYSMSISYPDKNYQTFIIPWILRLSFSPNGEVKSPFIFSLILNHIAKRISMVYSVLLCRIWGWCVWLLTSELAEYGGCDDNVVVREKVMEASFKSLELPPFTFRLASQNISRVNSKGQKNICPTMPYFYQADLCPGLSFTLFLLISLLFYDTKRWRSVTSRK